MTKHVRLTIAGAADDAAHTEDVAALIEFLESRGRRVQVREGRAAERLDAVRKNHAVLNEAHAKAKHDRAVAEAEAIAEAARARRRTVGDRVRAARAEAGSRARDLVSKAADMVINGPRRDRGSRP